MIIYHLAQLNIGRILDTMDSPTMAGFAARLDEINALAESASGFVWRLQSDSGNATDIQAYSDPMLLVNMSVWTDVESLRQFAYRTVHAELIKGRRAWFEKMEVYQVLWWIPAGHIPTVSEAKARLELLQREGATAEAFTFTKVFLAQSGA